MVAVGDMATTRKGLGGGGGESVSLEPTDFVDCDLRTGRLVCFSSENDSED